MLKTSAKRLLVVDANILSHALNSQQANAYAELFTQLEKSYRFVVTGFTKYEISRSSDKSHRDAINSYITSNMTLIDVSEVLLDFTGRLRFLYSKHSSTKGKSIGDGDIINAALSVVKDAPLLTMDSLDYPTPFFRETDRRRVQYQSKNNRDIIDTVYILEPDLENIKYCFEEHEA